tara:strand:+ start:11507 stop:11644 length:138 start_codon:yes stop_codon:yes gene_type:complete
MTRNARKVRREGSKDSSPARLKLIKYQIKIFGTKGKRFFKYLEKK